MVLNERAQRTVALKPVVLKVALLESVVLMEVVPVQSKTPNPSRCGRHCRQRSGDG